MHQLFKKIDYDSRVYEIASKTENTKVNDISNLKKNKRKRAYSTPTYGLVENTDYDLHLTNIQNVISHTDAKRKRIIGNQNRLKECVQKQKNIMQMKRVI